MKAKHLTKKRLRFEQLEGRQLLSAVPGLQAATATSTNWSGYALTAPNGAVTAVSGAWTVPTVSGSSTGYSSEWVGIDGYNSSSVEQIGTESDTGPTNNYAWYEMYPNNSVNITTAYKLLATGKASTTKMSAAVSAGDSITASVQSAAANSFTLTINDLTADWTYTTVQKTRQTMARSSAEWIVEAPSSYSVLPLADFGTVNFTAASATISGVTGSINGFSGVSGVSVQQINMVSNSGAVEDTTSTTSGTSFSVAYNPQATPAPAPAPTPPSGYHHHHGWGGYGYRATNIPSSVNDSSTANAESVRDQLFASLGERGFLVR